MESIREYCPKEFQRKPRDLVDVKFFKAKEFRLILAYTGPVIFHKITGSTKYNYVVSLHIAYRILNNKASAEIQETLDYARHLLVNYIQDFSQIFRPDLVSYNIHALQHVVDDVEHCTQLYQTCLPINIKVILDKLETLYVRRTFQLCKWQDEYLK